MSETISQQKLQRRQAQAASVASVDQVTQLQQELAKMQQELASNEAQLAGLMSKSEPSTNLEVEMQRVQDVSLKSTAFERVIVAQRRECERLQEELRVAIIAEANAALTEAEVAAQALMDKIGDALWELVDQIADLDATAARYRQAESAYATVRAEPGFMLGPCLPLNQAFTVRKTVSNLLVTLGLARYDLSYDRLTDVMHQTLCKPYTAAELAEQEERRQKQHEKDTKQMLERDKRMRESGSYQVSNTTWFS